jgi:hypothetical protein
VLGSDDARRAPELDLPAQVGDVLAQRLSVLDVCRAPDLREQDRVRQGPAAMAQQGAQQLEENSPPLTSR